MSTPTTDEDALPWEESTNDMPILLFPSPMRRKKKETSLIFIHETYYSGTLS